MLSHFSLNIFLHSSYKSAQPVSVLAETYGTGVMADTELAALVQELFDLRPASIISTLDLRRPIFQFQYKIRYFVKIIFFAKSIEKNTLL